MILHHIGIVVDDIDKYFAQHFDRELGQGYLSGPVFDPLQDSYLALVEIGEGAAIELIVPAGKNSPVAAIAKTGGGFHHLCYEVQHVERTMEELRSKGLLPVRGPDPAVLFGGRKVGFMFSRTGGLIELIELRGGAE
jgi:methylmalonyl-CoA/ethylmalonyl-CoA epimerase